MFFRQNGRDLREKMKSGRQDLSDVKVSASYDTWRPKKYRKAEKKNENFQIEIPDFPGEALWPGFSFSVPLQGFGD